MDTNRWPGHTFWMSCPVFSSFSLIFTRISLRKNSSPVARYLSITAVSEAFVAAVASATVVVVADVAAAVAAAFSDGACA